MSILRIPVARVFLPLLADGLRYLGAWGGRGSGKSYFFADRAINRALDSGTRIVCIREVQKTLEQSAKRLIEDRLKVHNLGEADGFRVYKDRIETPGDGVIIFMGMQDHTAEQIKSLENFDIAWVEEAQTLSEHSLKTLRPTIRKEGSQIWFSWNPRRKADPVDVLLRPRNKAGKPTPSLLPTGAVVVKANWNDNPWFTTVLEMERLDCLRISPDQYDNIWDGGYVGVSKGAYYAKQLAQAKLDGRVSVATEDPLLSIGLFCDIGGTGAKSDAFSIWAGQFVGTQIRVLSYYEAQGQDIAHHLAWMKKHKYVPERCTIWLPHDGKTHDRVYSVSYESAFTEAGYTVEVVPNQGPGAAAARIDEGRRLFPSMIFNEPECEGGLESLAWYHEKIDPVRNIGLGPNHDWASHGADAFGLMAVAHEIPQVGRKNIKYTGW